MAEQTSAAGSRTPEFLSAAGSLMTAVGLFLPWYATDPDRTASNIDGVRGEISGWTVHEAMRYVILVLALIQLALALAALRPGADLRALAEATMVMAVNSFGIVIYFGLIFRPGEPPATIDLQYGWAVATVGTVATLIGAVMRAQRSSRRRSGSPIAQTAS